MKLLVDGNSAYWRAYSVGYKSQNHISIFLSMLKSYKKMYPNSTMWICWDKKIDRHIRNPRYELLSEYKSERSGASEVFEQIELVEDLVDSIGINNFYPSHLEADDCIAWLSQTDEDCIIFSADNDLAQLVSSRVSFYNLNKKQLITKENFKEMYGISSDKFLLYKCIIGDQSDKIPGIPKHGHKRSKALAETWDADKVKESYREIVEFNNRLMNLSQNEFLDDLEIQRYEEQYSKYQKEQSGLRDISKFEELLTSIHSNQHLKAIDEWKRLFTNTYDATTDIQLYLNKNGLI